MGSQVSKTTFMMGVLLYVSLYVRGAVPCLWVQATEELAKVFMGKRLRRFLEKSGEEALKGDKWKNEAFRVNNSEVKVGISTSEATLRTHPARFIFGDEFSIWVESIAYVKQRARTFEGCSKGIFVSTPPKDPSHHCVGEMRSGNWWQWWVPCQKCGERQPLLFMNLKWYERDHEDDSWDYERVEKTARFKCRNCGDLWSEDQKLDIINLGRPVCVDYRTYEPKEPKKCNTDALQIGGMYSVFTSWGNLAVKFLTANASGPEAIKRFITDELAEIPEAEGESLKDQEIGKYIDSARPSGMVQGYQLYTAGIDVQRAGKLYYVIMGWKRGSMISGHVLKYGVLYWREATGKFNWNPLLQEFGAWQNYLYRVALDSTDGVVTQDIFDFCHWAGKPYIALKDTGMKQLVKVSMRNIGEFKAGENYNNQVAMVINSSLIKDEIAAALRRAPGEVGAWSFPADTSEEFLQHLTNEHRATVRSSGRLISKWVPRWSSAPQHFFSALVYATAAMEDQRYMLQITQAQETGTQFRRTRSRGIEVWQ